MTDIEIVKKYVTLYYADWCSHCVKFKPEWFKFKSVYNKVKQEIKDKYKTELIINEYENETNGDKIKEANVDGFPTIKITYNNKIDDYIGDRTAKELFKKLIPQADDTEINNWLKGTNPEILKGTVSLDKEGTNDSNAKTNNFPILQLGGIEGLRNYGIKVTDPKKLYANSYRRYMKYKKKCENLGLS